MRILFLSINDPFTTKAGLENHVSGISQALVKLGCEVHILVLNSERNSKFVNGVRMHYLDPSFKRLYGFPLSKLFIFNLFSYKEIVKLCQEFQIDIVHGQSPSSIGYGLLRKNDLPFIVTLHATSFGEMVNNFVPIFALRPSIIFEAVLGSMMPFLTYLEYKSADKVIAVSKATAEEAIGYYRLPKKSVVAIHNGLNLKEFSNFYESGEGNGHMILSVGRLSQTKGFMYLINAMPTVLSKYPDAKLVLVGGGLQRPSLQDKARKLGIENSVIFLSRVSVERLSLLYSKATVYVQPSIYEPFGLTILEAMSMKKPIIATRVGGIPELITNGVEGILVEPKNSIQLAMGITKLLSDSICRKRLASNARKKVEAFFTWDVIAKKTLELYLDLLHKKD